MTCHTRFGLLCSALLFAAGCGDDGPKIELTLTAPAADSTLTMADDDTDIDRPGLQFDVAGSSNGIGQGTTVNLFIDDDKQALSAKVASDGAVAIPDVTLPPGTHQIYLQTSTSSATSDKEQTYTLRAVVIAAPDNGAIVTKADDTDADKAGVQINVAVDGYALEADEKISLRVDGDEFGDAAPDKDGHAVFEGVTLSSGKHSLVAYAGSGDLQIESGEVRVEVQEECVALTFNSPEVPAAGGKLTLGGDDCPSDTLSPFVTRVAISTDAGDGRKAQLIVNGRSVASAVIEGATATFEDVVLTNRRDMPNTIAVTVENSDGVTCHRDFPAEIFVDCAGASCSITGPKPASYVDDEGDLTLFLNRSLRVDGDNGFDVMVESDKDVAGQAIKLVIDGRERDAIEVQSQESGDVSSALFAAVALPEGSHAIEAFCSDEHGNITSSGEQRWVVDITACSVDITDPQKDSVFVPGNDDDEDKDGVQVVVSSDVEGDDCSARRSAVCTPTSGIKGPKFVDYSGKSPLLTSVTLDSDKTDQNLCVEVEDRAGNLGRDDVAISFRDTAPKLEIESPGDGAKVNAKGNGDYLKDADTDTVECDAEFSIACSEVGVDVQLHRDAADGDEIGNAKCKKPGSGDPGLPDGYNGRAIIQAAFLDGGDSATLVATQSAAGDGSASILGKSSAITIEGDCEKPALAFDNDPCAEDSADSQLTLVQAAARDVKVTDSTGDIEAIELAFENTDDDETNGTPDADESDSDGATYDNLDLGGEGDVTITVTATDDFDNSSELSCTAAIVNDLLTVTAPTDGQALAPGDDCDPSGSYGVLVQGMADQQADRTASVVVNGGSPIDITSSIDSAGAISGCVTVPAPGQSTLAIRVTATASAVFAEETRSVAVVTSAPSAGTGIPITSVTVPATNSATYRTSPIALAWATPTEDWPGQLVSYELRCANSALDLGTTTQMQQDAWWTGAETMTLPADFKPPATSANVRFRIGDKRYCVLRGADGLGQQTPPEPPVVVVYPFRSHMFTPTSTGQKMGQDVAPVGDVNGDGFNDLLVGGVGEAYLIFGSATGWTTTTPDVVFVGSATSRFGAGVVGLGDFNDDGMNDFAISDAGAAVGAAANAGRVFVFYGRPLVGDANDWPATVNITGTCAADVCLDHEFESSVFGLGMSSAGDFNGDGVPDLAVGAPGYPASTGPTPLLGRLYVVLGQDFEASMTKPIGQRFWQIAVAVPSAARGLYVDGDNVIANLLGYSVAPLGNFDGTAGDDLVVAAPSSTSAVAVAIAKIFYLSGHPYDFATDTGMKQLGLSELGLRDMSGVPSGLPIDTGTKGFYGVALYSVGNAIELASGTAGARDLAVKQGSTNEFLLYPGDNDFSASDKIRVQGDQTGKNPGTGISVGSGYSAVQSFELGDLDGDGLADMCAGEAVSSTTGAAPGEDFLWYSPVTKSKTSAGILSYTEAASVAPSPAPTGAGSRIVEFVGDLDDDGEPDLAIGDPTATSSNGALTILY